MAELTCKAIVGGARHLPRCGKPATLEGGQTLCARHRAGERRRQATAAKAKAKYAADQETLNVVRRSIARSSVFATPYYNWSENRYERKVVLDLETFETLVSRPAKRPMPDCPLCRQLDPGGVCHKCREAEDHRWWE